MDLDSKEWMGRARAEPEQPMPIAAPPPFVRGETVCGLCSKAITTEALALADGRLVHSTCLLCVRCGIRLYDEYKANGPTRIFCENCGPAAAPTLPAKHVQDTGDILKAAEWYYSDGDSNDGPVTVEKLAKLFKGKTITEATFVWSEVLGDDADWLPLSDKKNEALLALVRGSGGGGSGAKPPPAAAKAAAAEVPVAADACAGCGGKLGVDVIQALDKQWHSKCFVCAGCSLPFDDGMFVAKEGKPYHKACAAKAFGATCAGCGELIDGKHVVVDGQKYHKTCFVCTNCKCTLEKGYANGPDGKPYCAAHARGPFGIEHQGAAAAAAAAASAGGMAGAARLAGEAAAGGDRYTVDVRTGEKVYIEGGTSRKYRLKDDGTKAYEDEKPRPVYGGAATWAQGGARPASGSM